MDYRVTAEDKERIKFLNEVAKNKFMNFSLKQLIRFQELQRPHQPLNQLLVLLLMVQLLQLLQEERHHIRISGVMEM